MKVCKRRNQGIDAPGREADHAPLTKDVDAKPVPTIDFMGEIERTMLEEELLLDGGEYLEDEVFDPLLGQDFAGCILE